jgi:hypothetical protein
MFNLCTLALRARSPASRLRGIAAPPRLRATRTPTPITFAIAPMSVCTNFGLDQSSSLGANAVYVVLSARLRAQGAHVCALAIANEHKHSRVSYTPRLLTLSLNSL